MKFSNETIQYLKNEKFSNGLIIPISKPEEQINSRLNFIEEVVKEKDVIHVGCCDHIPLIEQKIKNNQWLHRLIVNSANRCIGVDTNKEGIDYLKDKLLLSDVYNIDITKQLLPEIIQKRWDFLILGELLEHIDNPVEFLKNIRELYKDFVKDVIISVPNAFSMTNLKFLSKGQEVINTDHRYWFTPYTLAKVLSISGYQIDYFLFAQEISFNITLKRILKIMSFYKAIKDYNMLKTNPALRNTIIMVASLK